MARELRPVVALMLVASILFVADGLLDHAYEGGSLFAEYHGLGWTSYLFAVANFLMAVAVARGSERTLVGRIALSGFFLLERPLTAFVLGPKPPAAILVHFGTAVVELVILVGALRVWRLSHSVGAEDLDALLSLRTATPAPPRFADPPQRPPADPLIRATSAWLVGGLTLLLAAVLVADGAAAGFVPGGREWGVSGDSSGWLVYLFAVVALVAATRAVHGGTLALRLLLALALIFFLERAFSPFALRVAEPILLGLHALAAFVALALALACAAALREARGAASSDVR